MNNKVIPLTFVADLRTRDRSRQQIASDVLSGKQVRVARGVYVPTQVWEGLRDADRYVAKVHAVARTRQQSPIVSHWSAAALHALPAVGPWPSALHITVPPSSGSRSRNQVVRHALPLNDSEIVEISGIRATSLARTIVDVAALGHFLRAVVMADYALRESRFNPRGQMCTRAELVAQWERRVRFSGFARAREVIDFAVEQSESVLESVSRVNMALAGFPRPRLQAHFSDHRGLIGYSDFYWPEFSLIGEADGDQKYLDPAFRSSRTAEEVLLAQAKRENRLRALDLRVCRWDWTTAISSELLRDQLRAAGLPAGSRQQISAPIR
ncbi:MAG: hypothetical protein ABI238_04785 [Terrimesophilobacter sp.]